MQSCLNKLSFTETNMASRGRGARAKGANFERYLGHYISDNTPLSARRGLAQTRGGGAEVSLSLIHI